MPWRKWMMRYWKLQFSMDLNLCSSWWWTIEELSIPIALDSVFMQPHEWFLHILAFLIIYLWYLIGHHIFLLKWLKKKRKEKNPKYLVNYVWRLNIMLQKYKKLMQRILGSKPMFSESNRSSNWKVYWFTDRIDGWTVVESMIS